MRPSSKGVELVIKCKFTGTFSPPIGYRMWVQAGGDKDRLRHDGVGPDVARRDAGREQSSKTLPALAADVRKIDILLEPDTRAAENHTGIEEIWGGSHQIRDVPLQRFDLGDGGTNGGAAGANREMPATQAR